MDTNLFFEYNISAKMEFVAEKELVLVSGRARSTNSKQLKMWLIVA